MKFIILIFLIIFSFLSFENSFAQGCSDAGLCSIDMNHSDKTSSMNYNYSVGLGLGEQGTIINTYKMSLFYSPIDNVTIFTSLPFSVISGDITSTNGVGDIDFGVQYSLKIDDENSLKYSMSLKTSIDREAKYLVFPSGIAEALPMVFHPSLGNDNFVVVVDYQYKKYSISAGALIPLTQPNNNKFVTNSDLEIKTKPLIFDEYLTSASLERSSDLMLRVIRAVYQTKEFTFSAGINPIFRTGNNKVTFNESGIDRTLEIEKSGGLTLNLLADIDYQFSSTSTLSFSIGVPVITRTNQNDGLLRFFQSRLSLTGNIF